MSKSELRRLNIQFEAKIEQLEAENDSLRQLHTAQMEENERLREQYYELIWAVANKHPDESRHETALRYITERENQEGRVAMSNALKESE